MVPAQSRMGVGMGLYDWSGRWYEAFIYLFKQSREERIKKRAIAKLELVPGARVLDWGCGTGMSLKPIQERLEAGHIYGVDRSPSMLKHAVARAKPSETLQFHFVLGDGLQLELPEKVDAAVACYALGILEPAQFEKGVEAIWRNMKPQGKVAIVETEISPPTSFVGQLYQRAVRAVSYHLFEDKCSEDLMPTVERFFEPVEVEHIHSEQAIAFVGTRRDVVLHRVSHA